MGFEPAAALIGLREGLEALLIVGILLGLLRRFGHAEKARYVWAGAALGVLASVALGLVVRSMVARWFEDEGAAVFEIVAALVAVGILTYMVVWMYQHTKQILGTLKRTVHKASTEGRWALVGSLAFVTVLREGLETVLFFSTMASRVGWPTLMLSGLVGLAASAGIAFAIFRMTVGVDIRRFFSITGIMLVFIAAGLLVHTVHAASDLGWLPHEEPLWDTSSWLPDEDHVIGGPLHALVGYEDTPTVLQLTTYVAYLVGVGGWYLSRIARPERRRAVARASVATLVVLLFGITAVGALGGMGTASDHDHGEGDHDEVLLAASRAVARSDARIGLLVRDHGEIVHYNATTYESVADFVRDLWPYTGLPEALLSVDAGTYFIDDRHPFDDELHVDRQLVDAWLAPWALPAVPVVDPLGTGAARELPVEGSFYFVSGVGPGVGEPDVLELVGLGVYRDWLKMENTSPRYADGLVVQRILEERIEDLFGERVVVAFAHGIDPKVRPDETHEAAAAKLVAAGVDVVVDAYQSSIRSDAMDACMMAPHVRHALEEAGFRGRIVAAGQPGLTDAWAHATLAQVEGLLAGMPSTDRVSVHLAQHGATPGSPNPCGSGVDQYHANARAQAELAREEIERVFGERLIVRHVYGSGADAADDGVLSPTEALAADVADDVGRVLILPYEFWGNSVDNLVNLRESLGFAPAAAPYYDSAFETRFTWRGMSVLVASAAADPNLKAEAQLQVLAEAIVDAAQGP